MTLRWTRTAPTEPGWYWRKSDTDGPIVVHVMACDCCGAGLVCPVEGAQRTKDGKFSGTYVLDYNRARWAGPIPPPEGE